MLEVELEDEQEFLEKRVFSTNIKHQEQEIIDSRSLSLRRLDLILVEPKLKQLSLQDLALMNFKDEDQVKVSYKQMYLQLKFTQSGLNQKTI